MPKHPQVFQPKIIVHQSGLDAICKPSNTYSAFSPATTTPFSTTKSYSSLCRGGGGLTGFTSTLSTPTTPVQPSNTMLNQIYYEAFKNTFPSLMNQCHPFSDKKTANKRFVCNYPGCGKMFGRNEEKTRHEKIHSGVKPFACELCSKRFGRKDHLTQHMRTHNRARREDNRRDENGRNQERKNVRL